MAVDDADTTFDWEIPWGDEPLYAGPSDMELLDICFARDDTAEEGWSMDVKTGGCDSDETDAATAKADGLSTEDDDES